mmetsp:Transcript_911/g.3627  ORF Transcript_911/g.3627 Transcript_911/m.3627 type:complete len:410 (-) Transcript_911:1106-2335(-)
MSDGAEEAVENAPAVATTDPPTTPVARTPSQTDAVVIGGTSPRDDDRPPPAFTEEDLRRMEEERVRVQELYLREADLKRREKAVAVAELSSPESLAAMNAERVRQAENFRLEALAKKATRGKDDAPPPPPPPPTAVATETTWMERERLERRRRYELEAIERRRAAERAVTAEDVLRRKEAEASARRAMAEAMYAPSFVPPPSAVLGPNSDGGDAGGGGDDGDAVRVVTLEEVLHAAPTDAAAADAADDTPGDVERGPDSRCDEGDARGSGDGSGGATPDEGKGEGAEADESPAEGIDADAIDAVVDRLAADADEDEAWDELDETHGAIEYERIPWPDAREISGQSLSGRLPAGVERARLDRLVARYHPDEFFARYGDRIDEAEKARALEKVREVSRAVEKRRAALLRDL